VLSFTDVTAINGQTYYYRVSALNSVGESLKSNEATATPLDPNSKTMMVTVGANKPSLSRSETCIVTITVKDAYGMALKGAAVAITLYEPNGISDGTTRLLTDMSGTVRAGFGFASTVPTGTYRIDVTVSLTGYQTTTSQVSFTLT
jgi:hypothetical protein